MLTLTLLSLVAHAGRWDGAESDIVVERTIDAPADALWAPLTHLESLAQLFPEDCVTDWTFGTTTAGVGALTRLTYRMGPMRRRLTATITRAETHRYVDIEHEGNKGFLTRFRLEPVDGGTQVTLATWIAPPPWPFGGVYFARVHPAWVACYERTLDALAAAASAAPTAPATAPAPPEAAP